MTNRDRRRGRQKSSLLLYTATVVFSVLFLFFGHKFAAKDIPAFRGEDPDQVVEKAVVEKITDRAADGHSFGGTTSKNIRIAFQAKLLSGKNRGKSVSGVQNIQAMFNMGVREVNIGSKVLLIEHDGGSPDSEWQFVEYQRTDRLLLFGVAFVVALLLFGRRKGFDTLLSLALTCAAIFAVFIPSILSGKNIHVSSIVICLYTIGMTYAIVNGFNKKSLAASLGCVGGIAVSGILTAVMSKILALTGYVDEESIYLAHISTEHPIDLRAIIFAAIIIGALGAIMDVSMSIASSLWEVSDKAGSVSFDILLKSGMNIGRDVMGTMSNTLILAYIGSSLSIVLLLSAYSTSLLYLLNREMIIVEVLQALVGSFGILSTMPLTSLVCAMIYTKGREGVPRTEALDEARD